MKQAFYYYGFFILLLSIIPCRVQAQVQSKARLPIRDAESQKWGLIDGEGKVIIPLEYDFVEVADFGYVRLEKDQKWGLTDSKGKILLPTTYQGIKVIDSLIVSIKEENKYGIWSKNGQTSEIHLDRIVRMKNSYALAKKDKKYSLISPEAKEVMTELDTAYFLNSKYAQSEVVLAKKGKQTFLPTLKSETLSKQALNRVKLLPNNTIVFGAGRPLGLADSEGNVLLAPAWASIVPLSMDKLALKSPTASWELYDSNSKKSITTSEYSFFEVLDKEQVGKERIIACKDGKCGLMDGSGKWIVNPSFEQIYNLQNHLLAAKKGTNEWLILNTEGKQVQATSFALIYDFAEFSSITKTESQSGQGLIDTKGKTILPPKYSQIEVYPQSTSSLIFAYNNQKIEVFELQEDNFPKLLSTYPSFKAMPLRYSRLSKPEVFRAGLAARNTSDYRWQQNPKNKKYYLRKKEGGFAFKESFDVILIEPISGFALGKNHVNGSLSDAYLINQREGKVISNNKLFHVELTDFRTAEVARAYADSIRENALLTKTGLLVTQLASKTIDTMTYFSQNRLPVKAGKWGVVDEKGQTVVAPLYDEINPFESGVARIKQNGKFGLINLEGKLILPTEYDFVGDFQSEKALIVKDKKVGLVNTEGKVVIAPQYERMSIVNQNLLRVRKGNMWGLVNTQNKAVLNPEWQYISKFSEGTAAVRKDNLWGFINEKGQIITSPSFEAHFVGEIRNGKAKVGLERYVEENEFGTKESFYRKNGVIDTKGNWILEPVYSFISDDIFKSDETAVLIEKDGKVGYADQNGKVIVSPQYDAIDASFEEAFLQGEGVAQVRSGNKLGYVNHEGKELLSTSYQKIKSFEKIYKTKDAVTVVQKDRRYGTIDRHNNIIIPFEYDFIGMDNRNDTLSFVKKEGKWGVINPFGRTVVPMKFSGVKYLTKRNTSDALIEVFLDSAVVSYIDQNGQLKSESPLPQVQIIKENGKYGLQNSDGEWLVSPKYDLIEDFGKIGKMNWSKVAINEKGKLLYGVIDEKGNEIITTQYLALGVLSEGKIATQQNHKSRDKQLWGYLDENGKKVIDFAYYQAEPFSNDMAMVRLSRAGRKMSYINSQNEVVIKSAFISGSNFSEGVAIGENYLIDKKGTRLKRLPFEQVQSVGSFQNGIVGLETEKGFVHITKDGQALYPTYFDSLTAFRNGIAFIKVDEKWQLLRRSSLSPDTVRVNFSAATKKRYESKYKKNRVTENKYGEKVADLGFEKVDNGYWLMIDENGSFVSPTRYRYVSVNPSYTKLISTGVYGYADLDGNWIAYPKYEARKYMSGQSIQLERAGQMAYLGLDGSWIWNSEEE